MTDYTATTFDVSITYELIFSNGDVSDRITDETTRVVTQHDLDRHGERADDANLVAAQDATDQLERELIGTDVPSDDDEEVTVTGISFIEVDAIERTTARLTYEVYAQTNAQLRLTEQLTELRTAFRALPVLSYSDIDTDGDSRAAKQAIESLILKLERAKSQARAAAEQAISELAARGDS